MCELSFEFMIQRLPLSQAKISTVHISPKSKSFSTFWCAPPFIFLQIKTLLFTIFTPSHPPTFSSFLLIYYSSISHEFQTLFLNNVYRIYIYISDTILVEHISMECQIQKIFVKFLTILTCF